MSNYNIFITMWDGENIASANIQLLELILLETQNQIKAEGGIVC